MVFSNPIVPKEVSNRTERLATLRTVESDELRRSPCITNASIKADCRLQQLMDQRVFMSSRPTLIRFHSSLMHSIHLGDGFRLRLTDVSAGRVRRISVSTGVEIIPRVTQRLSINGANSVDIVRDDEDYALNGKQRVKCKTIHSIPQNTHTHTIRIAQLCAKYYFQNSILF